MPMTGQARERNRCDRRCEKIALVNFVWMAMTNNGLRCAALLIALVAPGAAFVAAEGIGSHTGTSTPQVVTPSNTVAPPQTPAYPPPRIGATTTSASMCRGATTIMGEPRSPMVRRASRPEGLGYPFDAVFTTCVAARSRRIATSPCSSTKVAASSKVNQRVCR
jgi:hypothetical protein